MKIVRPERVAHTYTQRLDGTPEEVFPLLCPVRECDWVNGWDPSVVMTTSGIAELDCVFLIGAGQDEATWVVSEYQPPVHIEFFKFTPGHSVARITIDLKANGGRETLADVTYGYTAISPRGVAFLREFTHQHYQQFMQEWETELNHYLRTGTKLPVSRPVG